MIRPVAFRMNEQTAVNNYYQKVLDGLLPATVNAKAQEEFDAFVKKLRSVGVNVIVVDDTNYIAGMKSALVRTANAIETAENEIVK